MDEVTRWYKQAASKLGYNYSFIEKNIIKIRSGTKSIIFKVATCSCNSSVAYSISNNKNLTYKILKKNKIPVFRQNIFSEKEYTQALEFAKKKLKFPVVIKPYDSYAGKGINCNIKTIKTFKTAFKQALTISPKVIVEKYHEGDDYRFLVCKGKLLAVTKRIPAYVVGNNKDTIKKLITSKNKHSFYKTPLNIQLTNKLKDQDLSLKYKPKQDEKITLLYLANQHLGGETENIDIKNIHAKNKKIAIQAANLIGLNFGGIDILSKDIAKPYTENKAAITEVNASPGVHIQLWAKNPMKDIAEKVLKILLT